MYVYVIFMSFVTLRSEYCSSESAIGLCVFFFKQKTAYEMLRSLVGSEMCIRDRSSTVSSESMESEVIDNKGRKLPDWYFEFSDSDAEDDGIEREELKSKEQKLQEKMDSLLESSMSSNAAREWQTSLSTIIEFGKRSEEYQQRTSPNPRTRTLR
eukprot:TRINITY_DN33498_c0_g1_i1.p1 TRINITY_DN33498_c0_g1~~TRINITY_DN33498_c0_g1_i1.p1  ORF type:complete len:155 (+),score=53.76 TRINITY_DN33498_c0_g1_i1:16-480(+)